jgi:hypothetical protein
MQLSAENFRGERKAIRLETLTWKDPDLQGRANPEEIKKRAAEVAAEVKAGAEIDPIKVIHITADEVTPYGRKVEAGYYTGDGIRRCYGYEMLGRATIPAIVRVGTWADLMDVVSSANAGQVAIARTPEDKRRQVEISMRNHPDRAARWHAQHCQVSNDLTAKVWKIVEKTIPKEVLEKIKAEGKVGRDGKRQTAEKKKTKPKPATDADKAADWKAFEDWFNKTTRFVDHVAELDGGKMPAGDLKKLKEDLERLASSLGSPKPAAGVAHKLHKLFGDLMLDWKSELARQAMDAAAKAKAAAEKEAAA